MVVRSSAPPDLAELIQLAMPICRQAQDDVPCLGPGCPPTFADWHLAMLIILAVLTKHKRKSAQYRWLSGHRDRLIHQLNLPRWPARSTYFRRYQLVWPLLRQAIARQGQVALAEGVSSGTTVAVDKSLLKARGPVWHARHRRRGHPPRPGVDREADWGYSPHHDWVYGYSYEVVVTAQPGRPVLPLAASADRASQPEAHSFPPKIAQLPDQTRHVLGDTQYAGNALGEAVEYRPDGRRTGRRMVSPPRGRVAVPPPRRAYRLTRAEQQAWRRRQPRLAFYRSARGRRLYRRRGALIEPFHDWFKQRFELADQVWHRGLANNRTQVLAALFAYQLLLRCNHRRGRPNGQIQWILDHL